MARAKKYHLIRQFLKDVAWGQLDYLVVDSPPGTGDEPLSVAQLVGSPAGAVIVTTPQEVAISDVRRCVSFCNTVSLPIVGIVENMSGFACPRCGAKIDLFKRGGGMALALEMRVPFLGQIPIDLEVVTAGDAGMPLVHDGPQSPATKAFSDVVDSILTADAVQNRPRTLEDAPVTAGVPVHDNSLRFERIEKGVQPGTSQLHRV